MHAIVIVSPPTENEDIATMVQRGDRGSYLSPKPPQMVHQGQQSHWSKPAGAHILPRVHARTGSFGRACIPYLHHHVSELERLPVIPKHLEHLALTTGIHQVRLRQDANGTLPGRVHLSPGAKRTRPSVQRRLAKRKNNARKETKTSRAVPCTVPCLERFRCVRIRSLTVRGNPSYQSERPMDVQDRQDACVQSLAPKS